MKRGQPRMGGALASLAGLIALTLWPVSSSAIPVQYDLSFQTSGQSIWDAGESQTLSKTEFLGIGWENAGASVDAIVSGETDIPNPLRAAYDIAFGSCTALGFSASTCINGQSARVFVPALGSRPSVRSCGTFNVGCQLARAGDLAARTAYDAAFATCTAAFSSSVCRNGQSAQVPVAPLGTAPPTYLEVDTRSGVAMQAVSDGRIGLELGVQIDSGSVDATVSYQATFEIPDELELLDRTTPISFNTNSTLAGVNTLDTTFPTLAMSLDAIMQLSGSVSGEACLVGACAGGGTTFNIDERAPVLSFNQDGEGGVQLFGQSPSLFGFPDAADGFPFTMDVAGLAEITLHLPQPDASGGLDASQQILTASGQDDLIDLLLDVDNIIATAAGAPGLFGSSVSFGPLSAGFDIINVQMGPTIDLVQDFELDPTLFVSMAFDQAVMVGGQLVTSLVSAWDMLPDITFLSDSTSVTPTFFVQSTLQNSTLLDFDFAFIIDLLQVYYSADPLAGGQFGIGNVLDQGVDLFRSPAFFSNLFALGGWNLQIGDSFTIDFLNGATGPASSIALSAFNTLLDLPDALSVPEPGTLMLMAIALVLLAGLGGTRRRKARRR